ncbi:MAG: DAK2 domain-containing protein [Chloroflexota bacterium]|nr:DAK2 domain-containing protein [Chloroflexota bacterium]
MNERANTHLDASGLLTLLSGGAQALEVNLEAVNALNVFPVPDGDTGTNMLLTLKTVVEAAQQADGPALADTASAAAHGALMGARGNSGVILSQFIRGLASAVEGLPHANLAQLADAFAQGGAATYRAVSNPVEGTMLTVMRRTGEAMQDAASSAEDALALLEAGLTVCREAVLQTPEQLQVLRDAGVVDAGGQGFSVFLEGGLLALRGEDPASIRMESVEGLGRISDDFLMAVEEEVWGFCTQFIITGEALDPEGLRGAIDAMANSTVVIGDTRTVRVHAHTLEPDALLDLGRSVGVVDQIKVESMDTQHQAVRAARTDGPPAAVSVLAVVRGDGLEGVFRSLGVEVIVSGGQTMNPSTEELLEGIRSLHAESAVLLPNNKNIVASARQAAEMSPIPARVVPTTSLPQGIAAMLGFSPVRDLDGNAESMTEGAESVADGEVVTAVRDAVIDGTQVRAGEVMSLLRGKLAAAEPSMQDALLALVRAAEPDEGSLVTLYYGGDATHGDALLAADAISGLQADIEVEVVYGGQPHYHYLVSIE